MYEPCYIQVEYSNFLFYFRIFEPRCVQDESTNFLLLEYDKKSLKIPKG